MYCFKKLSLVLAVSRIFCSSRRPTRDLDSFQYLPISSTWASLKHFIVTVYSGTNSIDSMDSLHPGTKPKVAVIKQIKEAYILEPGKFVVKSVFVQKQTGVDCGAFSVANLWCVLKGVDPRSIRFRESTIRSDLYKSFKVRKVFFHHKLCKPRRVAKSYIFEV